MFYWRVLAWRPQWFILHKCCRTKLNIAIFWGRRAQLCLHVVQGCCTWVPSPCNRFLTRMFFPCLLAGINSDACCQNVVWRVTGYAWGWVTLEMGGHCLAKCKGNSGVENVSVKLPLMSSQALHTSAYWRVEVVDFTSVFSQRLFLILCISERIKTDFTPSFVPLP